MSGKELTTTFTKPTEHVFGGGLEECPELLKLQGWPVRGSLIRRRFRRISVISSFETFEPGPPTDVGFRGAKRFKPGKVVAKRRPGRRYGGLQIVSGEI